MRNRVIQETGVFSTFHQQQITSVAIIFLSHFTDLLRITS